MREAEALALLVAVWVGALNPSRWPVFLVVLLVAIAIPKRQMALVLGAAFVLASSLSARSERLYVPIERENFSGSVLVVGDPETRFFSTRVLVRLESGERLFATGPMGSGMERLEVGQSILVEGRVEPVGESQWLKTNHIVGDLTVASTGVSTPTVWWLRPSNLVRSWVADGAELLPFRYAALYSGLVVGDDRQQSASQRALFRSGGLTHLLAVSGQNVAFALSVSAPLIDKLARRNRLLLTLFVLLVFALATRLEPSVMRASATAALAAWATHTGRSATGLQVLCLASTALILIDPFLGQSVGFQLSVSASIAILVLAPTISSRLVGPVAVRNATSVTLAAQAGVAPILISNFGPMSASSIPANLLAGPAAGFVMTWGLSVGLLAVALPEPLGRIVQWPVGTAVGWISGVSSWAAHLPLPLLGIKHLAVSLLTLILFWALGGRKNRWLALGRALILASLVLASTGLVPRPPSKPVDYSGSILYPSTAGSPGVLVLGQNPRIDTLEQLLADRVFQIDLVISVGGGYQASRLIAELTDVIEVGETLAPPQHRIVGALVVDNEVGIDLVWGRLVVGPSQDRHHLELELPRAGGEGDRFSTDG